MQKYLNNSIMSKFIKNLLYNVPIPICDTVSHGDFIVEGHDYVYETNFIRCIKTGYIGGVVKQNITYNEDGSIKNIEETNDKIAGWINLFPYEFGKVYNKLTHNYISKSAYYDYETHENLGEFLRCLRDVKGINLMPFYNMYSDEYVSNYKIVSTGLMEYYNNTFKLLKVPIKFNKTYTIAIDCPSEVWICPAYFKGNIPLMIKRSSGQDLDMTERLNEYNSYVKRYNSLSYSSPITFRVDNADTTSRYADVDCTYFQTYEKDLVMLIQLPLYNVSTITILEGDYTKTESFNVINNAELHKMHESELNSVLCSNLSLLQFSTKDNYVYSDRIIEYLLWNVICSQETIVGNIEYVQNIAPNFKPTVYTPGVWNRYMRYQLYKFCMQYKKSRKLDMNGFVDKDTEALLMNQIYGT